jgi:hypothetical protein
MGTHVGVTAMSTELLEPETTLLELGVAVLGPEITEAEKVVVAVIMVGGVAKSTSLLVANTLGRW